MKKLRHVSNAIHPYELPLMVNPFARSIRDRRLQFLEEQGVDRSEYCCSYEGKANSFTSVDVS
jgi:hypothetical protein